MVRRMCWKEIAGLVHCNRKKLMMNKNATDDGYVYIFIVEVV